MKYKFDSLEILASRLSGPRPSEGPINIENDHLATRTCAISVFVCHFCADATTWSISSPASRSLVGDPTAQLAVHLLILLVCLWSEGSCTARQTFRGGTFWNFNDIKS